MVNRKKLEVVLLLGGVFLLGAVTGGAITYAHSKRQQTSLIEVGAREHRRLGFERRLGLSAAQSAQIEAIFARHEAESRALKAQMMSDCGAPMHEHVARIDAEIRALLDPEQQRRFDDIRAKRRLRGLDGFGPPGDHPKRGRALRRGRAPVGEHGPQPSPSVLPAPPASAP